jgi:hypothetical protein
LASASATAMIGNRDARTTDTLANPRKDTA